MSLSQTHTDIPGRILACLVFLIGIGLLCLVFGLAWSLFRSPVPGLDLPIEPGHAAPPAAGIGVALTAFVRQLLLLALMTVAGSLIAGKGIHLYHSAAQRPAAQELPVVVSRNGRPDAGVTSLTVDDSVKNPPA